MPPSPRRPVSTGPHTQGENLASLDIRMTNPLITLHDVSFVLPDGRPLFADLNETLDATRTGLVGRNGVGKSVLARILAGLETPTTGQCTRSGPVHYLAQRVAPPPGSTVADLAGVAESLAALARIEAGGVAVEDFEQVGDRWDLRERLQAALQRAGLPRLDPATPASRLSGGQAMRVALAGALLSDADFLILDEPSNHLDRPGRQALIEQLRAWPRGLLVISHDRRLLGDMERILELTPRGLGRYGGDYRFYAERKAEEQAQAEQTLARRKHERRREAAALRQQQERQQRRRARGERHGKQTNQAKVLLDAQKERSEHSTGKLRRQHAATRERLDERVRAAADNLDDEAAIHLHVPSVPDKAPDRLVHLHRVTLPRLTGPTAHLDLSLSGHQRLAVTGANGSGKSTLLQVLAGRLAPVAGECRLPDQSLYLDQHLLDGDPTASALERLRAANRGAPESDLRMRLAQLGLGAESIAAPRESLSGGERLKAALACVLYADPPPRLLLLDEPGNHQDLPSLNALETLLRAYRGTLVVVSHDEAFLARLDLTDKLAATDQGWSLTPWRPLERARS